MIAAQVRTALLQLIDTQVDQLQAVDLPGAPRSLWDVTPPPGVHGQQGPLAWLDRTVETFRNQDTGANVEQVTVTQDVVVVVLRDDGDATDVYAETVAVATAIRDAIRDVVTAGGQYALINDAGPVQATSVRVAVEETQLDAPEHLPEYGTACQATVRVAVRATTR